MLHHALNQNHPFVDGNKRFALTAMETFLVRNGAVLFASDAETTRLALGVADGSIGKEESVAFVCRRTVRAQWGRRALERWAGRLSDGDVAGVRQSVSERRIARLGTAFQSLLTIDLPGGRRRP